MCTLWQKCAINVILAIMATATVGLVDANEYFSSIIGLESLLKTEEILLQDFKQHLYMVKMNIAALEGELQSIIYEHKLAATDPENYLTNPVNVYRLMKRLHTDWDTYEHRIHGNHVNGFFQARMSQNRATLSFPSQADVEGSALALVRLQEIYQLNVPDVAAGILNGIKYGSDMTWQDCLTLGQQLYAMEEYNHTKTWLKESMNRLSKEKYFNEPKSLDLMEGVAESFFHLGDMKAAMELSDQILFLDPSRTRAADIKGNAMQHDVNAATESTTAYEYEYEAYSYHNTEEYKTYEKVCREELTATAEQQRPLRCRYMSNGIAYRLLAPFKVEEHNLDPLVMTIYDVISDTKISTLKQLAMPVMKRSTVRTKLAHVSDTSLVRISKNAWLPYNTHPHLGDMLQELHDVTGLAMTSCEELQVANYGVGGHYEPHWDFFMTDEQVGDNNGNRIATAIFYLSHVEQGGATVFPFLNISVKPQKGNVLFWYNLHRSLDPDYRTKHAGCPVLKGSKWIGNVWIRSRDQCFARPCDLQRGNDISWNYQILK